MKIRVFRRDYQAPRGGLVPALIAALSLFATIVTIGGYLLIACWAC